MITRKPRVGERVGFGEFVGSGHGNVADVREASKSTHVVTRVEGNLCWIREESAPDEPRYSLPFIWNFPSDGTMNRLATIFEGAA